jgi:hypothetical protein
MNEMSVADLQEMLGIALVYKEMGFEGVQIDVDHAVEILERLLAVEEQQ